MPTATQAPTATMQGVVVPASAVDPGTFFQLTRRQNVLQKQISSWAGFGATDLVTMFQSGVIAGLQVRVTGTLTLTPGTGTIATTPLWPYGVLRAARFTANGQANLINASGWHLKVRDFLGRTDLTDRGVAQGVGGASPGTSRTQGTLALANEAWGAGSNVSAVGAGTPTVDLEFFIPIAENQVNLMGAIFAQTSATSLDLALDWENLASLFTLTGNATVAFNPTITVEAVVYTIPQANGGIVIPDLSAYHSLIQSRYSQVANGVNEIRLAGQGVGRQLLRLYFRTMNGAVPTPLPMNDTNYSQPYWRFGGNETPEQFTGGQSLAYRNEREIDAAIGLLQGFGLFDFASEFAFRDSVDESTASELRFGYSIPNAVALTSPYCEYVQETIFSSAAGA